MSEVLRLHCKDAPDIIMICTDDDAYTAEVQKDEKGEFIIVPDGVKIRGKNRKAYLGKNVLHSSHKKEGGK